MVFLFPLSQERDGQRQAEMQRLVELLPHGPPPVGFQSNLYLPFIYLLGEDFCIQRTPKGEGRIQSLHSCVTLGKLKKKLLWTYVLK